MHTLITSAHLPAGKWFASLVSMLLLASQAVSASANWAGYINDKSLNGERYGYLSSVSNTRPLSKLRLLCHSDEVFTLYIDERIIDDSNSMVNLRVDKLPALTLAVSGVNGRYEISNQLPDFWMLIAQMAAGVVLSIDTGAGGLHQYSLAGFTQAYLSQCGWSGEARNYQEYLHHYR